MTGNIAFLAFVSAGAACLLTLAGYIIWLVISDRLAGREYTAELGRWRKHRPVRLAPAAAAEVVPLPATTRTIRYAAVEGQPPWQLLEPLPALPDFPWPGTAIAVDGARPLPSAAVPSGTPGRGNPLRRLRPLLSFLAAAAVCAPKLTTCVIVAGKDATRRAASTWQGRRRARATRRQPVTLVSYTQVRAVVIIHPEPAATAYSRTDADVLRIRLGMDAVRSQTHRRFADVEVRSDARFDRALNAIGAGR